MISNCCGAKVILYDEASETGICQECEESCGIEDECEDLEPKY